MEQICNVFGAINALEPGDSAPLYVQLANQWRADIDCATLRAGSLMPSSRDAAIFYNVARATVVKAYDYLIGQGYLISVPGKGTYVASNLIDAAPQKDFRPTAPQFHTSLSTYGERLRTTPLEEPTLADLPDLNYGAVGPSELPLSEWRETVLKRARFSRGFSLDYSSDPFGYRPLRETMASYLRRARGIHCTTDQIAVFSGSQQAINLIVRVIFNQGDVVAVENPGFANARKNLNAQGVILHPAPVDQEGVIVEGLNDIETCRGIYVTPAHQDPTGVVLSPRRRKLLLQWSDRQNATIIEDDVDSFYRYGDLPASALLSEERNERVLYITSFWKVLHPLSNLAFVVVPPRLIDVFARAKGLLEHGFAALEQAVLADFIENGQLERHIQRMRRIYPKRRRTLIAALTRHFQSRIKIAKESSSTHMLVSFDAEFDPRNILECGKTAQLAIASTGSYYISGRPRNEFMIAFAHQSETDLAEAASNFAQLLSDQRIS